MADMVSPPMMCGGGNSEAVLTASESTGSRKKNFTY